MSREGKMKITLRPYQEECIDIILNHFEENNKQFIQVPTGGGKTFIFLHYLKLNSYRSIIVVPSKELEEQVIHWGKIILSDRSVGAWRDKKKCDALVITASSLKFDKTLKYLKDFTPDTIVIDEAHHAQSNTYKNFLENMKGCTFDLLGCTATPERLDGKSLLDIFGTLTFSRNILDLIRSNELCDIESYRVNTGMKISSTDIRQGDYTYTSLKKLETETRNNIIYKTFFDNCLNKKTLIFCLSVDHSITLANHLKEQGIKAESIYGDMSYLTRSSILKRFKKGETQVLTNCQILTEGFDEPSIEALIIARPTASKSLYCQMIGRGLRLYKDKKVCYLYEMTDNAHNICTFNVLAGFPQSDNREYISGKKLTDLAKEFESYTPNEIISSQIKYDIFNPDDVVPTDNGKINRYDLCFGKMKLTLRQQALLYNHPYINEMTSLEASFLIWKEKLKEKYGYN